MNRIMNPIGSRAGRNPRPGPSSRRPADCLPAGQYWRQAIGLFITLPANTIGLIDEPLATGWLVPG